MALKLNFREVTPEDTEILRMIALRNGKAEDYLQKITSAAMLPMRMV